MFRTAVSIITVEFLCWLTSQATCDILTSGRKVKNQPPYSIRRASKGRVSLRLNFTSGPARVFSVGSALFFDGSDKF
jgi:hypothetical protein